MKNNIKKILIGLLMFSSISIFAQKSETRELENFHKIAIYDGITVQLVPSDKFEVKVSGQYIDKMLTEVKNATLKIKMNFGSNFKGEDNHAIVYYKSTLSEIKATEGSYITSNAKIKGSNFEIKSIEGAEIDLDIEGENLNLKSATGGKIELKGEAENLIVSINTGGIIHAKKLKSKTAKVKVSAGGNAVVNVEKTLNASVSMGGTIEYSGNPEKVDESISLGGKILKR